MPTFSVLATPSIEEFGNFILFEVRLDEASNLPVTVNYRTLYDGTAINYDLDHTFTSTQNNGTITFNPGVTSLIVQVEAERDTRDEVDEHVVLELFDPTGADFPDDAPVLRTTGVILDDDGAGSNLALFVGDPVIVEGDSGTKLARFDVTLSQAASTDLTFGFQTFDGSAKAGSDYLSAIGNVTIPAGNTSTEFFVSVIGDEVAEGREWFGVKLTKSAGDIVDMTDSVGEAEIRDTDFSALPEISVEGDAVTEEFGHFMRFTVSLSEPFADAVVVSYRLLNDRTAGTYDLDHTYTASQNNGTFTFAPGQTTGSIFIESERDTLDEADENVTLELFNPINATFGNGEPVARANGIILDDDGAGSNLALFVGDPVVIEGDSGTKIIQFEIELSRPAPDTIAFSYQTIDGSARSNQDYLATSGTVTFVEGQDRAVVEVQLRGDQIAEGAETFGLQLSTTSPIPVDMTDSFGTATILDTDASALPELSVQGDVITEEFGHFLRFTVTLSEPFADSVTVNYRLLGDDTAINYDLDHTFTASQNNGTLTFTPGQTTASIFIEAERDSLDEADENVTLELFDPQNAVFGDGAPVARATGIILDDDGAGPNLALFVSDPVVTEGAGGALTARFEVELSRPAASTMLFTYETRDGSAKAGNDYIADSGSIEFLEGQTHAYVDIAVLGDQVPEASEFFMLKVTAQGATPVDMTDSVGEAEIRDTDAGPLPEISVQGDSTVEEFGHFMRFTVSLSEPFADTVTVNWRARLDGTATAYDIDNAINSSLNNGTLTFAPGQTTGSIFIEAERDSLAEADQNLTLELFDPTNATLAGGAPLLRANGVILDDDSTGSTLALFVGDPVILEGDTGQKVAQFEIELSRPASGDLRLNYETFDGTARANADYLPVSGEITFVEGQTRASIEVDVRADTVAEASEWFGLRLSNPTTTPLNLGDAVGLAEIRDNDSGALPVVSLTVGRGVEDRTNSIAVTVSLSEPSGDQTSVQYRLIQDGTADNVDLDQTFTSGTNNTTLVFAPGQTTRTIYISPERDSVDETDENVIVELFQPEGVTFGPGLPVLRANGIIFDEEGAGSNIALFVGDPVITEGDSLTRTANFEIELSSAPATALEFSYATYDGSARAGSDYLATSGTVTFEAGQRNANVEVEILGDSVPEGAEWFGLQLTNTSGLPVAMADSFGEATILDTDSLSGPQISLTGESTVEGRGNFQRYVVTLSEASQEVVTVDWTFGLGTALADDLEFDLTRVGEGVGTLTFAPGQTTRSLFFETETDSTAERDESTFLRLDDPVGASFGNSASSLTAGAFIEDNDNVGATRAVFAVPRTVAEGDGGTRAVAVDVLLSEQSSLPMTFDVSVAPGGTATQGADFALLSNQITFAPNQTRTTIDLAIFEDSLAEGTESFDLVLTPAAGTQIFGTIPTARIEIEDLLPDLQVTAFDTTALEVEEGGSLSYTLTVANTGTGTAPNARIGIYISTDSTITTDDLRLGSIFVGRDLAPDETRTTFASALLSDQIGGGSYFVGAIVDPFEVIAESNEANNASLPEALTVRSTLPDLVVSNVMLSQGTVEAGDPLTVSFTVQNTGLGESAATSVDLYLSRNTGIDTFDTLLTSVALPAGLQAGESRNLSAVVTVPDGTPEGDNFIGAIIDPSNTVSEADEANNTSAAASIDVTRTVVLQPNLQIGGLQIAQSRIDPGDLIDVTLALLNVGDGVAPPTQVGLYLSQDGSLGVGDTLFGSISVPQSIPSRDLVQLTEQVQMPFNTPEDSYRIIAVADPFNSLAEESEADNASTSVALTVGDEPITRFGDIFNNFLPGGSNDDQLFGFSGDDTLVGGGGNDTLDGGTGTDTARFSGDQSEYTLALSASGAVITHRVLFEDGVDQITSIELLEFADQTLNLDIFDGPTGLTAEEFGAIIELYIAYYNRAPDALGLYYWGTQFSEGFTIPQMADNFFGQPETQATYASVLVNGQLDTGNPSAVGAFVTAVYGNVLGRAPDTPGFNFWTDQLANNPAITPPNFILAIINGAKNPGTPTAQTALDQAYLATKSDLGVYFSVIRGMSDTADAAASLALFDGSAASVTATIAAIDGHYADALDPDTGDFLMPLIGVIDDPFL